MVLERPRRFRLGQVGLCFPRPQQEPLSVLPLHMLCTPPRSTADVILIVRTVWDLGLAIPPRARLRVGDYSIKLVRKLAFAAVREC